MSKTSTFVRMQSDGTLVRIKPDGTEETVMVTPPTPLGDEAITAAACRDPDAQPLIEADLVRMVQVSLVGYAVGGAFLNLAYYDVPYNLLAALVVTRTLLEKHLRSAGPAVAPGAQQALQTVPRSQTSVR